MVKFICICINSKEMVVNGTYATDVQWHCKGAKCQEAVINCPQNEYTKDGTWGTPCMFLCNFSFS